MHAKIHPVSVTDLEHSLSSGDMLSHIRPNRHVVGQLHHYVTTVSAIESF